MLSYQHHERSEADHGFEREPMSCTINDVWTEVERAEERFRPYASAHEALGVITEEFEEFRAEVFRSEADRDYAAMRKELVQLACTAIRAIRDICDPRGSPPPPPKPADPNDLDIPF
jgi:hypothetical protein